ncbi:uncharacterized protein LOC122301805 [Carya illinoinensis]|uniref:uncharacterized protein LOC122301805 n=1 Tax=Carya illinoinensis TaxID=32201 RepID=UPI001C7245AA|nr:uncharacterized protein LOC122301805 [Carya illinoinensis]
MGSRSDTIASLFVAHEKVCDINKLRSLFNSNIVADILKVFLCPIEMEDRMVWPHERNGQFSVQSCYRYILAQIGTQFVEASNVQTQHILWKHLWKMKVSNKVKKHVLPDGTCSICLSELETLARAVMSCNAIHKIWELYLPTVSIANNMSVVEVALHFCDRKLNKYVYDKVMLSPPDNALTTLHSFDKVKQKTQIKLKNHYRWQHPPIDWLKLNVDGAVFAELGKAGIGVMAANKSECEVDDTEAIELLAIFQGTPVYVSSLYHSLPVL